MTKAHGHATVRRGKNQGGVRGVRKPLTKKELKALAKIKKEYLEALESFWDDHVMFNDLEPIKRMTSVSRSWMEFEHSVARVYQPSRKGARKK